MSIVSFLICILFLMPQDKVEDFSKTEALIRHAYKNKNYQRLIGQLSKASESERADKEILYFLIEARMLYSHQLVGMIKNDEFPPRGVSLHSVLSAARDDARVLFRINPDFISASDASRFKLPIKTLREWIEADTREVNNYDTIEKLCNVLLKRWSERFDFVALKDDERAVEKSHKK